MKLFFRKTECREPPDASVAVLNKENFKLDVLERRGTYLVVFYADWCASCKMVAPVLDQIAREHTDITVGKVNIEKESALTSQYGIISVPTMIVFKNGNVHKRMVGVRSKHDILAAVQG